MTPYPLLFHPMLKEKVWGGCSLASLGKNIPEGKTIGESWELADLPDSIPGGRSIIANGELAGMTLRDAINRHKPQIMGAAKLSPEGGFPLLIKYLDARENLSVQVHPDEAYVAKHPETHLKSEAWVVIHADSGAVIYKGVRPGVTATEFAANIRAGHAVDDLVAVPVESGDCHYLPSGTCHALGAGIVVAEIQTPSDTTFRVFDWGRTGKGRELHIDQAMQCIHFGAAHQGPQDSPSPSKPLEVGGVRTTPLACTEYFEIQRLDALARTKFPVVTSGLPEVWMMIDGRGSGKIETETGVSADLQSGTTALMPAGLIESWITMERGSRLLRITLPSPLRGMIA